MPVKSLTYLDYFEKNIYFERNKTDVEEITQFLDLIQKSPYCFSLSLPLFFVIDYRKHGYSLLTGAVKNIIGYPPMYFLEGGLEFVVDIFQKDDFAIFNNSLFINIADFLKKIPQQDHHKYIFTFNYRLTNKEGEVINILQKASYIISKETGLLLYGYGTCCNITPFKKDTTMVQLIDKYGQSAGALQYENIATNYFYPHPEDTLLTRREKEILFWLAEGFSTKQLADKLHLAENTITNHRTNILRKTNTKNVAQLIAYAIKNGII